MSIWLVLGQTGRCRQDAVEIEVVEAADHQRIWRRGAGWPARRCGRTLAGGISGQFISASAGHDRTHSEPCGDDAVGADGFSRSGPHAPRRAGLSQPQGADLGSGTEEVGVLYAAEVL